MGVHRSRWRFIPARAGNADDRWLMLKKSLVHPRASGERTIISEIENDPLGSSPRERGTLGPLRQGDSARLVHPRASGERCSASPPTNSRNGSSPRERGTQPAARRHQPGSRFIPARAGNACNFRSPQPGCSVHPRASGERTAGAGQAPRHAGSSPRERGTQQLARTYPRSERFIPARAGNAGLSLPEYAGHAVHPRASGERQLAHAASIIAHGSSPRERGTLRLRGAPARRVRFIPARAGNANANPAPISASPVHPRASGERSSKACKTVRSPGSSPRERGTLINERIPSI